MDCVLDWRRESNRWRAINAKERRGNSIFFSFFSFYSLTGVSITDIFVSNPLVGAYIERQQVIKPNRIRALFSVHRTIVSFKPPQRSIDIAQSIRPFKQSAATLLDKRYSTSADIHRLYWNNKNKLKVPHHIEEQYFFVFFSLFWVAFSCLLYRVPKNVEILLVFIWKKEREKESFVFDMISKAERIKSN